MGDFFYLIPVSIALGAAGLAVFLWSLRASQYEDLDGAAERILFDDDAPVIPNKGPADDNDKPES